MQIQCPQCSTKGKIDDSKIPDQGAKVRCPRCKHSIFVSKPGGFQPSTGSPTPGSPGNQACPQCSRPVQAGAQFCQHCGSSLAPASTDTNAPSGTPGPNQERCSMCGRILPQGELIDFKDAKICAECKPAYVQRLQQGVPMPGQMRYAGFWIRVAAKILDGIAMAIINFIVSIPFNLLMFRTMTNFDPSGAPPTGLFFFLTGTLWIIQIGLHALYDMYFIGKFAATPGKMICKIEIVRSDRGRVTYLRALGRHFAEFLSGLILLIGYIMVAFDKEKRALHDIICDTRVIHK